MTGNLVLWRLPDCFLAFSELINEILKYSEGILRASFGDGKVEKRMVGGKRPFASQSYNLLYFCIDSVSTKEV